MVTMIYNESKEKRNKIIEMIKNISKIINFTSQEHRGAKDFLKLYDNSK